MNDFMDSKTSWSPDDVRKALELAYTCIFPENPDDQDLDEAGECIRQAISMTHYLGAGPSQEDGSIWKGYKDLQQQLDGANAMLSAIENMFPRHSVYRDIAEAVESTDALQKQMISNLQSQVQNLSSKLYPDSMLPFDQYYNYIAVISGGIGENVWDREICVSAPSISEAVRILEETTRKEDCAIISIEQKD